MEASLANIVRTHIYESKTTAGHGDRCLKSQLLRRLTASLKPSEVGESPEPRSSRLQGTTIIPLHSNLGNRTRLHLLKIQKFARCGGAHL